MKEIKRCQWWYTRSTDAASPQFPPSSQAHSHPFIDTFAGVGAGTPLVVAFNRELAAALKPLHRERGRRALPLLLSSSKLRTQPLEEGKRHVRQASNRSSEAELVLDMDGKKMLLPRPVTVAKKKIPGSARLACGWALLCACAIAFGHYHLPCSQATFVLRSGCVGLTNTKAAYFSALWIGAVSCIASQAAAAALALLLPRRHCRVSRELAFLSVALASAGHCLASGAYYILRAAEPCPGYRFDITFFLLALCLLMLGDIISSLALR